MNLREILDAKVEQYEQPSFIEYDPISIPHRYSCKEDIEISGLLDATIAWGNRKSILKSANEMMNRLSDAPYDFVINASDREISLLNTFVYRTFQKEDLPCFIRGIRDIYLNRGGLERLMSESVTPIDADVRKAILTLYKAMSPFLDDHSTKHIATPDKSAAKRICMYLRWMIRSEAKGVDFGLWRGGIKPSQLVLPLDVHVGNIALKLGLINRNGKDWKTATAITERLKEFRPDDPVAYDFALFSMDME